MKTFDYRRAWVEAARPAYEQHVLTNPQIMSLYQRVVARYRDIHQDRTLGIPWREDPVDGVTDREAFLAAAPADLAFAAKVLHDLGHWWPGDYGLGPLFRETFTFPGREWGAYWKFAILASQALRVHFGLYEFADPPFRGSAFRIVEGELRLCFASKREWVWGALGPADPALREHYEHEKAKVLTDRHGYLSSAAYARFEALRHGGSGLFPARWLPLVQTDRFMVDEETMRQPLSLGA